MKAIIDADIDGPGSSAVEVDASRPLFQQRALTRRIARTIFVGGAPTLRSAHQGVERPSIWLGVAIPGDVVGNFGSSLEVLGQRAAYLYNDGQRYWFDTQPSVARLATDMADRLRDRPDEVWAEVIRRLRQVGSKDRGAFAGVHVAPDTGADVPDEDSARLVIIHPAHAHRKDDMDSPAMLFAMEALDTRGSSQRLNRNMLVFLAADSKRLDEVMDSDRSFLAWEDIVSRADSLNLSPQ